MVKRALVIIDYTYDFVAADGKLTCGEPGQKIDGYIASLIKTFIQNGDEVIFTNDLHIENDPYHPETKLFPPHNIVGTAGRELYGEVKVIYEQNKERCLSLDKTRYSSFVGTVLETYLKERSINELHLVGVCTDICVLHTAVDGYNKGYDLVIHKNGVASFNEQGHEWALSHFEHSLGAKVI